MAMSKSEALMKHKELWLTVAKMTREQKRRVRKSEALVYMGVKKEDWPRSDCYCCEYANGHCTKCPVKWPQHGGGYSQDCTSSYYDTWADCGDDEWEEAAVLAEKIAELATPELEKLGVINVKFTKKDLQAGDIIELRNGNKYIVLHERFVKIYASENAWMDPESYSDDMRYVKGMAVCSQDWDIMKVYRCDSPAWKPWCMDTMTKFQVMFDREKSTKKMTVAEICKELGYEVEVVK